MPRPSAPRPAGRPAGRHALLAAALLAAAIGLTSCTGGDGAATPAPTAPVLVPGAPGEPAATTTAVPPVEDPAPAPADVVFAVMMVPHHQQAVRVARLAPERAADPDVLALAERIATGQAGEVDVLESWLTDRGGLEAARLRDGHGAHGEHLDMPGAVTEEQLGRLEAASGTAFDLLFLDLMVGHHRGALEMAAEALRSGTDVRMQQFATDVAVTQEVEVERMLAVRDRLDG